MTTTVLEKKIHNYTPHTITIRHYGNAGYIHREFESKGCAQRQMDALTYSSHTARYETAKPIGSCTARGSAVRCLISRY